MIGLAGNKRLDNPHDNPAYRESIENVNAEASHHFRVVLPGGKVLDQMRKAFPRTALLDL